MQYGVNTKQKKLNKKQNISHTKTLFFSYLFQDDSISLSSPSLIPSGMVIGGVVLNFANFCHSLCHQQRSLENNT